MQCTASLSVLLAEEEAATVIGQGMTPKSTVTDYHQTPLYAQIIHFSSLTADLTFSIIKVEVFDNQNC